MKKQLLFILIGLFCAHTAMAQMDAGLNIGASNYLGEIGGSEEPKPFLLDMKFKQTNITVGGFFRYKFHEKFAGKMQINFVRLKGADKFSSDPTRIARNLSFRTDIYEAMATGEYNFFKNPSISKYSRTRVAFESYVFTGLGVLLYYPKAQYDGDWYNLRTLATEGTQNQYSQATIGIPLGVGAHFTFGSYRLGIEGGYRFTFTDYLDDVSGRYASPSDLPYEESIALADRSEGAYQSGKYDNLPEPHHYGGTETTNPIRGNPDTNDGYLLIQVNVSIMISAGFNSSTGRYKSSINRRVTRRKF